MTLKMLAVFTLIIALAACGQAQSTRPDDFELTFEWDTGALPPQYHYAYTIKLGPGISGEFVYQPGYGDEAVDEKWQTKFNAKSADLDAVYHYLSAEKMLRSEWTTGQPLLGGPGTGLTISASGKFYDIPSVSELTRPEREKVEALIELIRGVVPSSIWAEMDVRQASYEAEFE